ncbi:MAG: hypothetical protein FWB72_07210 [Firmicutes bacterium]|nr:hypothetical protein [Bacillota bacterium]
MEKASNNLTNKLIRIVGWIIFFPTVLALLAVVGLKIVMPERSMNTFGFRFFLVADTASMEPRLQHHDLLVVRQYNFNDLSVGDIITFYGTVRMGGRNVTTYITHQIVDIALCESGYKKGFITRGVCESVGEDRRLLTIDGSDNSNKFVGKLVFDNRFLGRLIAFLQSIFGIMMISINAVLAMLLIQVISSSETDPLIAKLSRLTITAGSIENLNTGLLMPVKVSLPGSENVIILDG